MQSSPVNDHDALTRIRAYLQETNHPRSKILDPHVIDRVLPGIGPERIRRFVRSLGYCVGNSGSSRSSIPEAVESYFEARLKLGYAPEIVRMTMEAHAPDLYAQFIDAQVVLSKMVRRCRDRTHHVLSEAAAEQQYWCKGRGGISTCAPLRRVVTEACHRCDLPHSLMTYLAQAWPADVFAHLRDHEELREFVEGAKFVKNHANIRSNTTWRLKINEMFFRPTLMEDDNDGPYSTIIIVGVLILTGHIDPIL
jgi:hypothetical protein